MPLYLDVHHKIDGLTGEAVKDAHQKDLQVQHKHGVNYIRYWYDEGTGKVFCLVQAPARRPRRPFTARLTVSWPTRLSRSRKAHSRRAVWSDVVPSVPPSESACGAVLQQLRHRPRGRMPGMRAWQYSA